MSLLMYRNPRLLVLTIILIAFAGVAAYRLLPRSEDPRMTNRYSFIVTRWPGASAERVEALVTEKLEEALFELEDVRRFRSTSSSAVSVIQLELKGHISDVAPSWSRVRDKMREVHATLPEGVRPPYVADTEEADAYSFIAALQWVADSPPQYAIMKRLAQELESRFRFVDGTEFTRLFGAPPEEVLVEVDALELAALGLTPSDVARQVAAHDPKVSAGRLSGGDANLGIEVEGALDSLEQVAAIPVRQAEDGTTLHLGDLAAIERTIREPREEVVYIDGKPAIAVAVRMEPGLRIDRWSVQIREELAAFKQEMPGDISVNAAFDQSAYVERSLGNLTWNLLMGMVFVFGVTFFMMGARAAVLVGTTLPLSVCMVLTGMYLFGITVHQMSIMGLVLSLGLLIDNAIIMVDSVRTRREEGSTALESIRSSTRHLFLPLAGSTLTTILAFTPLMLMPGGTGDFVGPIGVTVVLSLVSSFVLAFTVVPALSGYLLPVGKPTPGASRSWWRGGFSPQWLTRSYERSLDILYAMPVAAIAISLVLPIVGFLLAPTLGQQFFPPSERDQFYVQFKMPYQTSIEQTEARARASEALMMAQDGVEQVDWYIGVHVPRFFYNLLTWERQRPNVGTAIVRVTHWRDVPALVVKLQDTLDEAFPEAQVIVRQLEMAPALKAPIEARVEGPDLEVLHTLGNEVRAILAQTPEVIHTDESLRGGQPKLAFTIDQAEADLAGLDKLGIAQSFDTLIQGVTSGSILEGNEELPIRVRLADAERGTVEHVASLDLVGQGPDGAVAIPVSAVGEISLKPEFAAITHNDNVRCNEIYGYVTAGVLPALVLADFRERLDASGFTLPAGYALRYGGEEELRSEAQADLLAPVVLLLVAMGGALVLSFNSFRLAALVAVVGVLSIGVGLSAIWAFGYPLGFMAFIGTMGLVGVAINDSIVVLAAIQAEQAARGGDRWAVRRAVAGSSRHVIATTVTTIAGFAPLYFNGGAFWPPLATAIAGGVAGATVLALVFVPAMYLSFFAKRAGQSLPIDVPAAESTPQPAHSQG